MVRSVIGQAICHLVHRKTLVDGYVFFHSLSYLKPKAIIFEQVAQPVAVDQLPRKSLTVPGGGLVGAFAASAVIRN